MTASPTTQNDQPAKPLDLSGASVSSSQKAAGAFRTISEVADELNVPQHVLRFWETKFFQVRPVKRSGGRRYYRPEDVALLKHIHHLLYTQGYTIRGVQKLLKGMSKSTLMKETSGAVDPMRAAAAGDITAANSDVMLVGTGGSVVSASPVSDDIVAVPKPNVLHHDGLDNIAVVDAPVAAPSGLTRAQRASLNVALAELKRMRAMLQAA